MKTYFITLKSNKGYENVITSMQVKDNTTLEVIRKKGLEKICYKRGWNKDNLKEYGYTTIAIREEGEPIPVEHMFETAYKTFVIMKNGLPIATTTTKDGAATLVKQFKASPDGLGIYKIHEVSQWITDQQYKKGNYKLKV